MDLPAFSQEQEVIFPSTNEELLKFLRNRGLLFQSSNETLLMNPFTFYLGFDLSADSLHLGHLLLLRVADILQKHGNNSIILLGGATTTIGDPTGKSSERSILSHEVIYRNKEGIQKSINKVLKNFIMVDNASWLNQMPYLEILQKFGRHISVNKMVKLDTMERRLSQQLNLSFLEFNYPILQSIDFLVLNEKYDCTVQIGGSDQWGNIISGTELAQRALNKNLGCFTIPLLLKSDGTKMGKSEQGAIWLNEEKTSPYQLWQYIRNIEDDLVETLLKFFSNDSLSQIELLVQKDINKAKIYLADILTTYVHGEEELAKVHILIQATFKQGDISNIPVELRLQLSRETVTSNLKLEELLLLIGIASSKMDGKRKISSGQIKINDIPVSQWDDSLIKTNTIMKISYGKKIHKIVEFV